jgi:hypothetical protein
LEFDLDGVDFGVDGCSVACCSYLGIISPIYLRNGRSGG